MVKKLYLFILVLTACSGIYIQEKAKNENTYGGIIKKNLTWENTVIIEKDVLIPEGVEVKIKPGTKIIINKSENTRTEPIFLQPETEILVRGKLIARGLEDKPITFISSEKEKSPKDWGGIVVDGGSIDLYNVVVKNASTSLTLVNGNLTIKKVLIEDNNYGIVLLEKGEGLISDCILKNNKTAIILDNSKTLIEHTKIFKNEEGLIIKNVHPKVNNLEITGNDTGVILPTKDLNFLLKDNRIYENKNNIFFFFFDNAFNQ